MARAILLAFLAILSPALAHGFGGPPMGMPMGGPPMGGPMGGPPMGGPPMGMPPMGGPHAGVPSHDSIPPGLQNRPTTPPGQEIKAAVHDVTHDAVGRPTDAKLLSAAIEHDAQGAPVVRGELLAVSPTPADLEAARNLGFEVLRQDRLESLGIVSVTLRVPQGMTAVDALARLRRSDPSGSYDYAHIYAPSGDSGDGAGIAPAPVQARGVRVGMIDGGVERRHPALNDADLTVKSFAEGGESPPTLHGTAVASLLVGHDETYSGYLPGAELYAADVFGGTASGGDAVAVARALDWLARKDVAVANVSLSGPPNALLQAAVKAFVATGHVLVAAAGNDGPAAPPNYPASYPGVVAVTSVDAAYKVELDANRVTDGFAALGVNVRAASVPQGYTGYTGTSYATPAVAAGFALLMPKPDAAQAKNAFDTLRRASVRIAPSLYLIRPSTLAAAAP